MSKPANDENEPKSRGRDPGSVTQNLISLQADPTDDHAFQEIYDRYAERVLGLVRRKLGRGGPNSEDDFLQETFARLFRRLQRRHQPIENRQHLIGYLLAVASGSVNNYYKAQSKIQAEQELQSEDGPSLNSVAALVDSNLHIEHVDEADLIEAIRMWINEEVKDAKDRALIDAILAGDRKTDVALKIGETRTWVGRRWKFLAGRLHLKFGELATKL